MNILLQNRETEQFVAADQWSANQNTATKFPSGLEAYDHCIQHGLRNMDIILAFDCPSHDVRVPVRLRN